MKLSLLTFMILLTFHGLSSAMERFDVVSTSEMKQMLEDRARGKIDFLLVNGLDEIIFRHAAIPGSINIPWPMVEEVGPERLGNDKNRLIITY